jgi:serine/threonine-protein kinase
VRQGEAGLTLTGEMVGTLRYMSPEQALAKRVVIDHRTDVYSLGATLYELLTPRPVFEGNDRQELLRQVAFEEPGRLRKLEKGIPGELETIVLKALDKRPQDRYATAQELADDLRRWLEDRPVQARRPSWRQVASKWARRHRTVVWSGAAMFLLAAVLCGVGGLREVQNRARAEGEARAALKEASELQRQEKWPEALSAVRRARAVLSGVWAGTSLRQEIDQTHRDVEMALRLQEARLRKAAIKDGHFDWEALLPAYAEAFRWYGLSLEGLDAAEAAQRIQGRSIHRQLVAALDEWAWARRQAGAGDWRELLAVARAADPDPWRNRLRDALERKDPRAAKELAASGEIEERLPGIHLLLLQGVATESMVVLLRKAQQRHPADFWINEELGNCLVLMRPPRPREAIRYYTAAVALRPQSPGAHYNLGVALFNGGQPDRALPEFREALHLEPNYPEAHTALGAALREQRQWDEAIREHREALRLRPAFAEPHHGLGLVLIDRGEFKKGIAELREAIRLRPRYAAAHADLGAALKGDRQLGDAIAAYRKAIHLDPYDPKAHYNLGNALAVKGKQNEAIVEYRKVIDLDPANAQAYCNLGAVLASGGQLDEAIVEFRAAVRLKKDYAVAHCNLGAALKHKGRLDEAIVEYRKALQIQPDYALALFKLGVALVEKGAFRKAAEELRRGDRDGSRNSGWPHTAVQERLRAAERLARLDARVEAVLRGKEQAKDCAEHLAFARHCQLRCRQNYTAAARFYREAFAANPKLLVEPNSHRYDAARAAALAGCSHGNDAAGSDDRERGRLRRQALEWLRAELAAWRDRLDRDKAGAGPAVRQHVRQWLEDGDFAGVIAEAALRQMPAAEREAWCKLWADAAGTLAQAGGTLPEKKPGKTYHMEQLPGTKPGKK